MYTPWTAMVAEIINGDTARTADLVRYAYAGKVSDGMGFQSLAQVLMMYDGAQGLRTQSYALEYYCKERAWTALIACAHDSLTFSSLRMQSLTSLLTAAIYLGDDVLLVQQGELICRQHAENLISKPQLLSLFFQVIVPHYHKGSRLESVYAIRRVLYRYNIEYSHLLYTHLQANLYSYTTDVAQELIGKPDVFAGS